MPLSTNEETNKVAQATVSQLQAVFGKHSGYRPAHAKGALLTGTFTPTDEAKTLSKAPHFNNSSTPIAARFSSSTGLPQLPDTDPNGDPRGFAVRFLFGERKHTDIIAHSTPFFPVNNGADFLAFFQAVAAGSVPDFLGSHPAALAFVQAPKPTPKSFATEAYFAVNAFKLVSADGKETYIRYKIMPDSGVETYAAEELKDKSPDFLHEEIRERLKSGTSSFSLLAQIAEAGDPTNDATIHWPEERKQVKLGTITIDRVVEDSAELQRTLIFDPVPRIDGVEASDDPLVDFRASVYLTSGRERRAAGGYHPEKLPKLSAVPEGAKIAT
ncbi:hypothetical protein H2198_009341 [Neophaeococcomyces mojaviensis]|uniref:Uncharacterized protein n=1 Tax=Neophaeococcomyces mojaviensis TaxID=3383035 RepID=A0ACC2ZUQ9_9EURO|nr:hypothetical protein H2198_009341 [Knufia sp. JES_112]